MSITPLSEPVLYPRFETDVAAALIERVETVQGTIPLATVFVAQTSVRRRDTEPLTEGWCGLPLEFKIGDIVIVFESKPGDFIAYPKRLITPDLADRMDRYR